MWEWGRANPGPPPIHLPQLQPRPVVPRVGLAPHGDLVGAFTEEFAGRRVGRLASRGHGVQHLEPGDLLDAGDVAGVDLQRGSGVVEGLVEAPGGIQGERAIDARQSECRFGGSALTR